MVHDTIAVLDCTVRDGGLINNHRFDHAFVGRCYRAVCAAGVEYMEIGYRNSRAFFPPSDYGPWKYSDDDDIRRAIGGEKGAARIAVMADAGRCDPAGFAARKDSPVDLIRVACYVHEMDDAIATAHHVLDLGYETTLNLMAVSHANERELDEALAKVAASRVPLLYIVDSFGSLYPEQIRRLAELFQAACPGRPIGIHAHNNQQLAFANTLEAMRCGASRLDSTIYGMGRGAGNCPTELLLPFLRQTRYRLEPILELIGTDFIPLRERYEWGYLIPLMVTGVLDAHPRSAIQFLEGERRNDFAAFYDTLRSMGRDDAAAP